MKQTCEYCHGTIAAPARCSMDRTVGIHLESCPATHRVKKAPVAQLAEAPDSSSGSVGSTPTGGTRKRTIPRQVL